MPTNPDAIKRGLLAGSIFGGLTGLFGGWLSTWNFLGLLFLPGMWCCPMTGDAIRSFAGPSNVTLWILLSVVADGVLGACIGGFVALVATYRRRPRLGLCACGYNLTGNQSGVCPECGRKLGDNVG